MDLEKALDVVMCKSQDVKPEGADIKPGSRPAEQLIYLGLVSSHPYLNPYFNAASVRVGTGYSGFSEKNEGTLFLGQANQAA